MAWSVATRDEGPFKGNGVSLRGFARRDCFGGIGGLPKYLGFFSGKESIRQSMQRLAFSSDGYFVDEYERIFVSHFGNNTIYEHIIEELSKHPYGLTLLV